MPGMTWNMITSGPEAGKLIHPLEYTSSEDEATRVKLWVQLATRLVSYRLAEDEGLDRELLLDTETSDEERAAEVADVILDDERVAGITEGPTVTTTTIADGAQAIAIEATYITITGAEIPITLGV